MSSAKTVIVTGASSGLGLAIAKAYLDLGFNVVGNARTLARLQEAAKSLGNPANFLLVEGILPSRKPPPVCLSAPCKRSARSTF